jgi:hypothetical protein
MRSSLQWSTTVPIRLINGRWYYAGDVYRMLRLCPLLPFPFPRSHHRFVFVIFSREVLYIILSVVGSLQFTVKS